MAYNGPRNEFMHGDILRFGPKRYDLLIVEDYERDALYKKYRYFGYNFHGEEMRFLDGEGDIRKASLSDIEYWKLHSVSPISPNLQRKQEYDYFGKPEILPRYKVGDVLRYGEGSTAFFKVDFIVKENEKFIYHGPQCFGAFVREPEEHCVLWASDIEVWEKYNPNSGCALEENWLKPGPEPEPKPEEKSDHQKYLEEYHHCSQTAIGIARLYLERNDPVAAK